MPFLCVRQSVTEPVTQRHWKLWVIYVFAPTPSGVSTLGRVVLSRTSPFGGPRQFPSRPDEQMSTFRCPRSQLRSTPWPRVCLNRRLMLTWRIWPRQTGELQRETLNITGRRYITQCYFNLLPLNLFEPSANCGVTWKLFVLSPRSWHEVKFRGSGVGVVGSARVCVIVVWGVLGVSGRRTSMQH